MKIPIVDAHDNILYFKDTQEWDREKEMTRSSTLWIMNEKKEILIAKRSKLKDFFPNTWSASASGILDGDESYENNIIKEAKEELGLNLSKIETGSKIIEQDNHKYFNQYFFVTIPSNTKFTVEVEEVDEVKWIALQELKDWHAKKPEEFLPTFGESLKIIEEYV